MKYILLTPCGLCLELDEKQAKRAFTFGLDKYGYDQLETDCGIVYRFYDVDRWLYDIKLLTK